MDDQDDGLDPEQLEMFEEQAKILKVADVIDTVISGMDVTNGVAVNALAALYRHASAQMYASAFGREDLHREIADAIEQDFLELSERVAHKATIIVSRFEMDGLLPN